MGTEQYDLSSQVKLQSMASNIGREEISKRGSNRSFQQPKRNSVIQQNRNFSVSSSGKNISKKDLGLGLLLQRKSLGIFGQIPMRDSFNNQVGNKFGAFQGPTSKNGADSSLTKGSQIGNLGSMDVDQDSKNQFPKKEEATKLKKNWSFDFFNQNSFAQDSLKINKNVLGDYLSDLSSNKVFLVQFVDPSIYCYDSFLNSLIFMSKFHKKGAFRNEMTKPQNSIEISQASTGNFII